MGKNPPSGLLAVEQRSRAILASWAACCLVDAAARRLHPELEDFHLALDFQDLRHLSLGDGQSHEALQAVCGYLRSRMRDGTAPVFSLRGGDATERLAMLVARSSEEVPVAWEAEQRHADARRDGHWAEVLRKQELARQLRIRLADERKAEEAARSAWQSAPDGATGSRVW